MGEDRKKEFDREENLKETAIEEAAGENRRTGKRRGPGKPGYPGRGSRNRGNRAGGIR